MDAYDLITDKIKYNQWANEMLIQWLEEQPAELLLQEVQSSFPTINKLLHHIMDAETYYLSILQGNEEEYVDKLPTDKILTQLKDVDQRLLIWTLGQLPTAMDKEISLKRSPIVETYTVATLLTHMINHTTYHRGQIVAMRHQLGMTVPPRTDYYRYFIYQAS